MDTPAEIPAESLPPPLPPPAARPPGPRLGTALLVSGIFYAVVFAVSIVIVIGFMVLKQKPDSMFITFASQVTGWPAALGVGLLLIKQPWRGSYAIRSFPPRLLPGLIIGCFGLTIVLLRLASTIPMPEAFRQAFLELTEGNPVIFFIAIVLIAPLAEELFFRGWMLRGFLANYSATKSIWLTAIIFALFHLNPWQGVIALPLGLLFGLLVRRTGSLAPGIIGHFVVNFSTNYLLTPFAMLFGHSAEQMQQEDHMHGDIVAAGAVLAAVGLGWLWRELPYSPRADQSCKDLVGTAVQ